MTDKISDEARELARTMTTHFLGEEHPPCEECLSLCQQTLTAARNKALEDAAKVILHQSVNKRCGTSLILDLSAAIRALKEQP